MKLPHLHGLNGMIYTDEEKVEEMANQLQNQCRSSYVRADLDVIELVNREMRIFMNEETDKEIRSTNIEEVTNIIKVTELPPNAKKILENIINGALKLKHFPKKWKEADAIAIPSLEKRKISHEITDISESIEIGPNTEEQDIYKKTITNWEQYRIILNNQTTTMNNIENIETLEAEVDQLTEKTVRVLRVTTMFKEENIKKNRLPIEMKERIKEKHRARKRAQRTLQPENKKKP
ncbi:hypothetical protein WA026_019407 [Henosepilachna vigintioctopunctata]|uniref:Uncharacterized protein n=1 Tax=Henosepilachna vigintioctopunctata TaxID=420089 RepID=A0AAW1UC51_9CUCU